MGIQLPNIEKYGDTIQEMSVSINEFSKFYVVTVPKIMSSTMGLRATEQGWGFQEYSVDISTHKMTPIGPTRGHQKTPNVNKRFEDDWNSLIAGRSSSKDIIILYRNPISKFITGLFEDTAITTFNSLKDGTPNIVGNDDISGLIRSLLKTSGLYTKNEITRFFKISYKKDTLFARHIDDQTRINELLDYKKYKNMYKFIYRSLIESYFDNISSTKFFTFHANPYMFYFNNLYNLDKVDKSKISFYDIKKTNIISMLNDKYGVELRKKTLNKRRPFLRELIGGLLRENIITISNLKLTDIMIYGSLNKRIYGKHLTVNQVIHESMDEYLEDIHGYGSENGEHII